MLNKIQQPLEWRLMHASDLADVCQIASLCHPDYPETKEVLSEKQKLSPQTCFVLEQDGKAIGYLLSHPWKMGEAPALDKQLGCLPENADVLYLHDIALLPKARASGSGGRGFEHLEQIAKDLGYNALALIAVNGADTYWRAKGFSCPELNENMRTKLLMYSDDALYMVKII